ncbi:hypothetical protein [Elioraea rosea]|uniref:hypothetical protein n=1 Tax=Elioraea rosea TaxID=2492390 RepID=UPI00118323C0|nr:hypothetical protein [Elioraea rosea]
MRKTALMLALLAAGCATVPHAWQNPETGALASAEEMTECRIEADREAQRSVMLYGWGGVAYPWGWRRGYVAPGWGMGWASPGLAISQRAYELTAFCLRVKGYRWLPIQPTTASPPAGSEGDAPADGKPPEEKPAP